MSKRQLNKTISAWLLALLLLGGTTMAAGPAAAGSLDARQTVERAVDDIIGVLTNPELAGAENSDRRYQQVVALVEKFFDFREISMRTMGPRWRDLNEEQRQKFIDLFKKYLERNYIDRVDEYAGEKILVNDHEVREDRRGNLFARVGTDFVMRDKSIPINYRMRRQNGSWMVYDVDIEGVSLVRNFRSQFEPHDYDELIRRMEESIASGQELDEEL